MEKTEIQRRIENVVTNSLGYDSRTKFLTDETVTGKYLAIGLSLLDEEYIKNSREGLRAHLADLDSKTKLPRLRDAYNIVQKNRGAIGDGFSLKRLRYSIELFRLKMGISSYESFPKIEIHLAIDNSLLRAIKDLRVGKDVQCGFGKYLTSEVFLEK